VIELQWQQKIKEIQASAQELNDEELNNKINTFQNNVSSKVSSGAIGQQELKNEYQDIIDYQNKVITNSKETKKSIEDTFKTYISEQDRIKSLGELKGTFDPSLFSKSNEEIKKYAQSLYGLDAKVVGFKKTVDGAGNAVIKMTVNTKNSKNEIQQETLVLDQNTNAVYKNGESIKSNTARMVGYLDWLKNALVKLLPSNMVTY
jgi:hypothetical protein